ncbi:Hypothetical predicted protein [Paramuricea clavata]|uniref:Uncharacterized protein n=1 Tax=Paramuricea clavata TaxID=317549 RepID=A0A6S7FUM8_PARCT|nr:Hypothetical predicted protein [Paramuricea clavata]
MSRESRVNGRGFESSSNENYFGIFKDETEDSETQDPTAAYQQPPCILKELRELKELMKEVAKKQTEMGKELKQLVKQQSSKNFDLAKSSHADNVNKILSKAYVQLGRFPKQNASKTEQLEVEFRNSSYGIPLGELMTMAEQLERVKFTYWRAEERRRLLGIGTWSSLRNASLKELATRICSLLGIKFNVVLEQAVFRQTALARTYIAENGQIESQVKNDKFWINFYAWKDGQYGARGPTELQWDVILQEE